LQLNKNIKKGKTEKGMPDGPKIAQYFPSKALRLLVAYYSDVVLLVPSYTRTRVPMLILR